MNNNEIKFDQTNGQTTQNIQSNHYQQPIQNNNQIEQQNIQPVNPTISVQPQLNNINQSITNSQQANTMQSVPTVEQSKQEFINNTQVLTAEKKVEKKQGVNWTFMIILFVVVLVSIIFLFPYLLKNL